MTPRRATPRPCVRLSTWNTPSPAWSASLRRPTHPTKGYALAVNRHGELARALGLPLFAAGAGYGAIDIGELPAGQGFDPAALVKTGR